jgi:hypothetical protein
MSSRPSSSGSLIAYYLAPHGWGWARVGGCGGGGLRARPRAAPPPMLATAACDRTATRET